MTKTLDDRLDDVQRQFVEMAGFLRTFKNTRADAEHGYQRLAFLAREEAQLRERHIEDLKRERAAFVNKTLFLMLGAGGVGALFAGLMTEIAQWLWAAFLAVVNSGWATLAAWWNA